MKTLRQMMVILFLFTVTAVAGQQSYSFSHSSQTYASLIDGDQISLPNIFENGETISGDIDFTFYFMGHPYDNLMILPDGMVVFGDDLDGDSLDVLTVIDAELAQFDGSSGIFTETMGTVGNRIRKIEFRKLKLDLSSTGDEFINFQLWLYEADNTVEMHYGPSVVKSNNAFNNDGPVMALLQYNQPEDSVYNLHSLDGNPTAPILKYGLKTADSPYNLLSMPPEGKVYTFRPAWPASTGPEIDNAAIAVYPNPVTNANGNNFTIQVSGSNSSAVEITDVNGRKVFTGNLENNKISVPNTLARGIYFITLPGSTATAQKLIIE